jgi:putative heme utilization carrier protein HutX
MNKYLEEFLENKKTAGKISKEYNVSELEVLKALEESKAVRVFGKDYVKTLLKELTSLGEMLIIIEYGGSVFEIKSVFPEGEEGHGFYNLKRAPFSGHLNIGKIAKIAVVSEIFFGVRSCSWRFLGEDGNSVFKVYVGRDGNREHIKEHLAVFEKWRNM